MSVAALGITNGYTIASYSHNELFVVLCFGAGLEGTGLTWLLVWVAGAILDTRALSS